MNRDIYLAKDSPMAAPENTMTISTSGFLKHQVMSALRFIVILATFASSLLAETCCGGSSGSGGSGSGGSSSGGCSPEQYISVYPASGSTLCPGDVVDVYLTGCSCEGESITMIAHFRPVPGNGSITADISDPRHFRFTVPLDEAPGPWEVEAYASGSWNCQETQPTFPNSTFFANYTIGGPTAGPAPTGTITVAGGVECQNVVLVPPGQSVFITIAPTDTDKTCKDNDLQDTFTKEHALKWESDGGGEFIPEEGATVLFVPPLGNICKIKITSKGDDDATAAGTTDDTATGETHVELASKTLQYFAIDGISVDLKGIYALKDQTKVMATLATRGCKDGLKFTYELIEISDGDEVVQSAESSELQHTFNITEGGKYIVRAGLCDMTFRSEEFVRYTLTMDPSSFTFVWDSGVLKGLEDATQKLTDWEKKLEDLKNDADLLKASGETIQGMYDNFVRDSDAALVAGEAKKAAANTELEEAKIDKEKAEADLEKANTDKADTAKKMEELDQKITEKKADIESLKATQEERARILAERQQSLDDMIRNGQGNSAAADLRRRQISDLQKKMATGVENLTRLGDQLDSLTERHEALDGRLKELAEKAVRLTKRVSNLAEKIVNLGVKIANFAQWIAELTAEKARLAQIFSSAGRAAAKLPGLTAAIRTVKVIGKRLLPVAGWYFDLKALGNWLLDTDEFSDHYLEMERKAKIYEEAIKAIDKSGVRDKADPPYSLDFTITSKPGSLDFQLFENKPEWRTKESNIGPNTGVDGDFTHLVTIKKIYQLWGFKLRTSPGREGTWPGTFDFHGNLGDSTAMLGGFNSDESKTTTMQISLKSDGITEQQALRLAEIFERDNAERTRKAKLAAEALAAVISIGFAVAGVILACALASLAVIGVVALIGALIAIGIAYLIEWWFDGDTPLEQAIKLNYPLGIAPS